MAAPDEIYQRLRGAYGPAPRTTGETALERLLAVVLGQNARPLQVDRALARLRDEDLLVAGRLHQTSQTELEGLIQPAGNVRLKAARIRKLVELAVEKYEGSIEELLAGEISSVREELLGLRGLGAATADEVLLKAGERPVFVVDLAAHRILKRHGWIETEADYQSVQDFFQSGLEPDAALFAEFHDLLEQVGREHCGKVARCQGCPLEPLLPPGGICEPDW